MTLECFLLFRFYCFLECSPECALACIYCSLECFLLFA